VAAAASEAIGCGEVDAIEQAYFPWIGALHTLLDSLVDHVEDVASGQQSLISYYESPEAMAAGMQRLAAQSVGLAEGLNASTQHLLLLTAMTSLYLSAPEAHAPHALSTTNRVLETLGDLAKPTMLVMAARRLGGRTGVL
jgi:tetraprenyl-beta-curcumene synthase